MLEVKSLNELALSCLLTLLQICKLNRLHKYLRSINWQAPQRQFFVALLLSSQDKYINIKSLLTIIFFTGQLQFFMLSFNILVTFCSFINEIFVLSFDLCVDVLSVVKYFYEFDWNFWLTKIWPIIDRTVIIV